MLEIAELPSYPHRVVVPVRFTDIDASGLVGHLGLARYHEDARSGLVRSLIKAHGGDTPLGDLRLSVIETFPGIQGCTHLNDVLRSLAEVP